MEISLDSEKSLATKNCDFQKSLLLKLKVCEILCICCNLHSFPEVAKWIRCPRQTFSPLALGKMRQAYYQNITRSELTLIRRQKNNFVYFIGFFPLQGQLYYLTATKRRQVAASRSYRRVDWGIHMITSSNTKKNTETLCKWSIFL